MIALVLERAGLDPTAVIGGRLSAFGSNARLGRGDYMVAEADESDRSFLKLSPTIAVITNIDREHMEAYGSFADLQQAFVDFANKVPFYGAVVACADDAELRHVLPRMTRRAITYGIDAPEAEIAATDLVLEGFGSACTVVRRDPRSRGGADRAARPPAPAGAGPPLRAERAGGGGRRPRTRRAVRRHRRGPGRVPGRGAPFRASRSGRRRHGRRRLRPPPDRDCRGAGRRPAAAPTRIVVAFQPHRYSRTAQLLPEFAAALAPADEVVLTEIYAASEEPIPGVTVEALAEAVNRRRAQPVVVVKKLDDMAAVVADSDPAWRPRDHARAPARSAVCRRCFCAN